MSRPPAVGKVKPYKTPPRTQWTLDNGLEVVLISDRRMPMVTARLAFRAGSAQVAAEDAGLSEAMAELLTDGTAQKTSKQISDAAEEYGGALSAESEADSIVIHSYGLAEHADKMLSLMAEAAREASFPEEEVALRKKNMQEELNLQRGQSDFLASVAFYKKLYGKHPYAITAPNEDSIGRLNRAAVVSAHRKMLSPRSAVLVLVGDLGGERARKMTKKYFGSWKGLAGPAQAPAPAAAAGPRRVYLVDRPGAVQASLVLGNLSAREDHPEYFNLLVANQILGGSFSSRLVQDIRETKGYAYTIGSRLSHQLASSFFRVRTPVRTEVTGPALTAIFGHLKRIREEEAPASELEKAKSFLIGSFARAMETQEGVAGAVLRAKLHRLPDDYYDIYVEKISAVTAAGARKAASSFLRPEAMTVVAVGDAGRLKSVLAEFSPLPVVSLDQDGN